MEKMLKGPDPVRALEIIHDLGLYPLIFTPPMDVKLPDTASNTALLAASLLSQMLNHKVAFPRLRPELTEAAGVSDTVRKRLYLACSLAPYAGLDTKAGKRKVWAGEVVVGESIKVCPLRPHLSACLGPTCDAARQSRSRLCLASLRRRGASPRVLSAT